jgi:hypothetical protein
LVERLEARFGTAVTTRLVPGGRGVFDVDAGGKQLFSKHAVDRFPADGEIEDALAPMIAG